MNMKDIDSIRNEVMRFVKSRVKELQMLEKRGKEPGAEEVACVCEQILEFWCAHFDSVPRQLRELLWVVQGLMSESERTLAEAVERGRKYGFIPPFRPFHLGGLICPSPWDIARDYRDYLRSLAKNRHHEVMEVLIRGMDIVLNEVMPEYKDQWRD